MGKRILKSNTDLSRIGLSENYVKCDIPPHLEGEFGLTDVEKIVAFTENPMGVYVYKIADDHNCPWARYIENNLEYYDRSRVDGLRIYRRTQRT